MKPVDTCEFCGFIHSTLCPRISAIEYFDSDESRIRRIEFHAPVALATPFTVAGPAGTPRDGPVSMGGQHSVVGDPLAQAEAAMAGTEWKLTKIADAKS